MDPTYVVLCTKTDLQKGMLILSEISYVEQIFFTSVRKTTNKAANLPVFIENSENYINLMGNL